MGNISSCCKGKSSHGKHYEQTLNKSTKGSMGNNNASIGILSNSSSNQINRSYQANSGSSGTYLLGNRASQMDPGSVSGNTQHISERDPDDVATDPSLNPTAQPLFIRNPELKVLKKDRNTPANHTNARVSILFRADPSLSRRYSSCATIIMDDSTVSRPNGKTIWRALAMAIYYQIRNRDRSNTQRMLMESPQIFDERLHPVQKEPVPSNYATNDPDLRTVYRFVHLLFKNAQLSAECAVVTMVYLERLLTSAEIDLFPGNWKRILLCCILLASKVWDDQAVWNVDYCQILRDLKVDDVNELERQFLEIIQFNINVPSSVYAKYYFDIRALCDNSQPVYLSYERAYKLEAISRICEDPFHDLRPQEIPKNKKRSGSLDTLTQLPRSRSACLPV